MYELMVNGLLLEDAAKNLGYNILIKIAMFYPIFYTIRVSSIIEAYSKNSGLSKTCK